MPDYGTIPTARLVEMWESGVSALRGKDPSELVVGDIDAVYEMRRELDRRGGEPNPGTEVNFEADYVTD